MKKIDEAIEHGKINPEHITPADLRKIGIKQTTSSVYLSNNSKFFIKKRGKGVYKRKRIIIQWDLDDQPITVELYPSVIRIKDNAGNVIRVDKRKGYFIVDLKGEFEFGRDDMRA